MLDVNGLNQQCGKKLGSN